jgi:CubicO group peptidase (beta-lactamase class C family)
VGAEAELSGEGRVWAHVLSLILLTAHQADAWNGEAAWDYARQFGTQAMIVHRDGKVVFERYAEGGGEDRPQPLASGSKSFHGAAAVAAQVDGLIKLDDKVSKHLAEWRNSDKEAITISQLLSLTSGIVPGSTGGRETWLEAVKAPVVDAPGEKFRYGPRPFLIFGEMMNRVLKTEKYEAYLQRRVLDPLGIKVRWGLLPDQNAQLAGAARMTARDWMKFGEFIREGHPKIVERTQLEVLFRATQANSRYGLTWWLSGEDRSSQGPKDFSMAAGLGKQRLYVIPSLKLVACRLGPLASARAWSDQEFLSRLLKR